MNEFTANLMKQRQDMMNKFTSDMKKQQQEIIDSAIENKRKHDEKIDDIRNAIMDMKDSFPQIISLIRQNNEINKELFDLFQELNGILLAKNETEAKGILTKVMEKAAFVNNGIGTFTGLASYGEMLLHIINLK